MPQAAFFPVAHRNAVLQALVGKSATLAAQSMGFLFSATTYIQIYSSPFGDTSVPMAGATTNPGSLGQWGSAIAGTAPISYAFNPDLLAGTGTMVWARWTLNAGGFIDGLVTLTTGGGMFIVDSLASTQALFKALSGVLIQPFNNAGTLHINGQLASAILSTIIFDVAQPLMGITGIMSIYGGSQPATADTPITNQTLLSTSHNLLGSSFASASGGSINLSAAVAGTANAVGSGAATWFRWTNGSKVMDGSVGTAGSGTDLILASTTFSVSSFPPDINAFTITVP